MGSFIPRVHLGQMPTWDVTWARCPDCPAPIVPDEKHVCLTRTEPVVAAGSGREEGETQT